MRSAAITIRLLALCLLSAAAYSPAPALAQDVSPTPEQLEMLRSLSPEERAALMDKAATASPTGTAPLTTIGGQIGETARAGARVSPTPEAPKRPDTVADLKPFGYDVFHRADGDFEPEAAIPVPNDYVLGPGDQIDVQLYGSERGNFTLIVGRDGQIRFPKLGPVSVGGMRFADVRQVLTERIAKEFVGTEVSVSMGQLRSIRVFVLGDVVRPGSYLVSALATISNALLTAGGMTPVGSLRNVELKRSGNTISRLDLYDLLLQGDTSNDTRLLAGDVVFVPPVGATVSVFGEFNRPAIYEVRPGTTISDLLFLSGGLRPNADPRYARLERVEDNSKRVTINVNFTVPTDRSRRLQAGDLLTVLAIRPTLEASVELTGAVLRPKAFQYSTGLYLTDIVPTLDDLATDSDPDYVLVRREPELGRAEYRSTSLRKALQSPRGPDDIELKPRDRVIVLGLSPTRQEAIRPLIAELRGQAKLDSPAQVVAVAGSTRAPGEYPLEPGMTLTDLVRAGGSAQDAAYGAVAELARYDVKNGEQRETEVVNVNLSAALRGDKAADIVLRPYDMLTIKQTPRWEIGEFVSVGGEVRFPGTYAIRHGETIKSLLLRLGGMTPDAYSFGAVFTRDSLRAREKEQIDKLADRLQGDLALLALRDAQNTTKEGDSRESLIIARSLLSDLRGAKAVGRLVIDLDGILAGTSPDLELRGGDSLVVPRQPQSVTVIGEVQSPTSHLWQDGTDRNAYLSLSGGYTSKADKKRVYVVHANGSVSGTETGLWSNGGSTRVAPGDTIVVPFDAERMAPLPFWTSVTTILYNLSIAAAAVNSF